MTTSRKSASRPRPETARRRREDSAGAKTADENRGGATGSRSMIPSVERKPESLGGGLESTVPAAERMADQNQI